MGAEHSSQHGKSVRSGLRRGKSVPDYHPEKPPEEENSENTGTVSPEPSVCSDSELPYISYTVNRPIGESPKKKPARRLSRSKTISTASLRRNKKKTQVQIPSSGHNIVVVKEAATQPNKFNDPDLLKLKQIPMFLPIMRATLHSPAARDPEVLERLSSTPLCNLCRLYQNYLHKKTSCVCSEQDKICKKIIQVEKKTAIAVNYLADQQKTFAKTVENFGKINEIMKQVDDCLELLKTTLELIETANNELPEDLKLEPFAWSTG